MLVDNRDEYLARPTARAQWRSAPGGSEQFLCGLDVPKTGSGGTWLGISRTGAFGVLTNFNEVNPPPLPPGMDALRSRGDLVRQWLEANVPAADARDALQRQVQATSSVRDQYGAFNLLLGHAGARDVPMAYVTNRGNDPLSERLLPELRGSTHALSNSTLSTPWQKVNVVKQMLADVLGRCRAGSASQDELLEELFAMQRTSQVGGAKREDMQRTICVEPVPLPGNSDAQAPSAWYGTRTATVVLITRSEPRRAVYVERDVHVLNDGKPELVHYPNQADSAHHERRYEYILTDT